MVTTVSSDEESDETESIAVAISLCVPLFSTSTTNQEIEAFLRDKKKVSTLSCDSTLICEPVIVLAAVIELVATLSICNQMSACL